jgi:hypothetical protein
LTRNLNRFVAGGFQLGALQEHSKFRLTQNLPPLSIMNNKIAAFALAFAIVAGFILPGNASAQTLLDTGTPAGTGAPIILSTSQWIAGEFAATSGEDITQLAAYLTQGVGQPGDTFTFDIYSSTGFTSRASQRPAPVLSTTGTFTVNGWNSVSVNWTPTTTGDYWLALQVASTTDTRGLDAPAEASASTGIAPALAFAYAPSSGQYTTSGAVPVGLMVTPEPSSWALALLCVGFFGYVRSRLVRA